MGFLYEIFISQCTSSRKSNNLEYQKDSKIAISHEGHGSQNVVIHSSDKFIVRKPS